MLKPIQSIIISLLFIFAASANADENVKAPKGNHTAGGSFIGSPLKGSKSGLIFKTKEFTIKVGRKTRQASTESEDILKQFQGLDGNKLWVFDYVYPSNLRFKITDTHVLITGIRPYGEASEMPNEVSTTLGRKGGMEEGTVKGYVAEVQRWQGTTGLFSTVCNVYVLDPNSPLAKNKNKKRSVAAAEAQTTTDTGGDDGEAAGALLVYAILGMLDVYSSYKGASVGVPYSVYSEELCSLAEKAMAAGKNVNITFSKDLIEIWDLATHIAHKITL